MSDGARVSRLRLEFRCNYNWPFYLLCDRVVGVLCVGLWCVVGAVHKHAQRGISDIMKDPGYLIWMMLKDGGAQAENPKSATDTEVQQNWRQLLEVFIPAEKDIITSRYLPNHLVLVKVRGDLKDRCYFPI